MVIGRLLSVLFLLFTVGYASTVETDELSNRDIIVIPVNGEVDNGMVASVGKAICKGKTMNDPLYIFVINTFGGRVDAAFRIVDTILSVKKENSVAFVNKKAISAGSLIALSCGRIVMSEGSTLGDCAPVSFSGGGVKMLGEKFQSPLRAKFRTISKRNGWPSKLAESMVSEDITVLKVTTSDTVIFTDSTELFAIKKNNICSSQIVVSKGKLLTMDNVEAEELGFSSFTADDVDSLLSGLGIKKHTVIKFEESAIIKLVRIIEKITPYLMMLGLAALYTEVRTPGLGIPGIVGVACIGTIFISRYLIGMADYIETIFIVVGVLLLLAEIFIIPGFGIAGFGGIFFLGVGIILSMQDFVIPKPEFPWQKLILQNNIKTALYSFVVVIFSSILFFKYFFKSLGKRVQGPVLTETLTHGGAVPKDELPKVSVGDYGIVEKKLRPSGSVKFDSGIFDAIADGEFVDVLEKVVVSDIRGRTVTVRKVNG